jgi:molybdate transport system regulatory protein
MRGQFPDPEYAISSGWAKTFAGAFAYYRVLDCNLDCMRRETRNQERIVAMKISARNVLPGTVSKVTKGAVNTEVVIALKTGETIAAVITNTSAESLGLKTGSSVSAILKASWIIVAKDLDPKKFSARNVLHGTISKVKDGAVNTEVGITLSGGSELTAIITLESSQSLGLTQGDSAYAVFKASSVIVAVD